MHHYDGGCGRCGKHKGEFLGRLPYPILAFREEIVREKFAYLLKPGRTFMMGGSSLHLCDKCWEKWESPVRVNWRECA
ncbi:hypothetical protein LCGC14_1415310 [marine sediment metagenome]|uniref:Uncharacterized protein n=1 Tax=marine sediment metagenome TaxID=412755 RepID=A0A0F9JTE6_9ZZZZ